MELGLGARTICRAAPTPGQAALRRLRLANYAKPAQTWAARDGYPANAGLNRARLMKLTSLPFLVTVVSATLAFQSPAPAAERRHDYGEAEYRASCGACHGIDAKGNGPMAAYLKPTPSDLTRLAKKNNGVFPFAAVVQTIDGRSEVKGHGSREMPVWGNVFSSFPNELVEIEGGENSLVFGPGTEAVVRGRILVLVEYLHRIQQK